MLNATGLAYVREMCGDLTRLDVLDVGRTVYLNPSRFRRYVAIDLVAGDGVLQRSICGDVSDLGQFDLVLDIGTAEHVTCQYEMFRNLFSLCRLGGTVLHMLPDVRQRHFENHAPYRYSREFFERLSGLASYSLVDIRDGTHLPGLLYATLRKTGHDFPALDAWEQHLVPQLEYTPGRGASGAYVSETALHGL